MIDKILITSKNTIILYFTNRTHVEVYHSGGVFEALELIYRPFSSESQSETTSFSSLSDTSFCDINELTITKKIKGL